jgi:hypothetical protein
MAATCEDVWEVIGGSAKGGIIVRSGKETSSPEESERLSKGAKIRIVDSTRSRVGYELISGDGPKTGWVTTKFQGKDLLVKIIGDGDEIVPSRWLEDVPKQARVVKKAMKAVKDGSHKASLKQQLQEEDASATSHLVKDNSEEAFEDYCARFGEQPQKEFTGFNRKAFPWGLPGQAPRKGEVQVQAELEKEMGLRVGALAGKSQDTPSQSAIKASKQAPSARFQLRGWAEDSDGEDVRICLHCKLPLGDFAYNHGRDCVHGECMAQIMVQELRSEENSRLVCEREKKDKQHSAYGIGWDMKNIPRNDSAASKLAMRDIPQGMVCLVLQESARTIRVASTMEPSAALNLEYLSTALQVRRTEGHEPVFSLDPVNPDDKNSMQEKVFVPDWLAGTASGEVLFQADYHLKELSMGEFDQPVVGMKSCFDYSEIENKHGWSAREWFLVRKAEVQLSDRNMLIPLVKMGVEAREQVVKGDSLEDKPVTRQDHPMVKYAEAFTQNFDLIAERKSVVFHLRELAKASVIAKYLLDSRMNIEEGWFNLGSVDEVCSLEVPQLWNERVHSQVHIKEGSIQRDHSMMTHGVYGGVQFGLDKFNLATSVGRAGAGISASMPQQRLAFGLSRKSGVAPVSNIMSLASGAQFAPPSAALSAATLPPARLGAALSAASIGAPRITGLGAAVSAMSSAPRLQGVDLRLDKFDLSEAKRVSLEAREGSWGSQVKSLDDCCAVGSSFFAAVDGSKNLFKDEDRELLRKVFHPTLSDRRKEGDLFVPPDASYSYVHKLRSLVKEEDWVRESRKNAFFAHTFAMGNPGTLFPHSWTPSFEIARGQQPAPDKQLQGILIPRPEYKGQAAALLEHVRSSAPVFDKSAEDGLRFRIYRLGSLEVRTTKESGGDEIIGAVFSIRNQAPRTNASKAKDIDDKEKITKVTEYVERLFVPGMDSSKLHRRYYLVLETEKQNKIVTERLSDGKLSWVGNPDDLEDRSSLAKLTRSDPVSTGVTVRDMITCRTKLSESGAPSSKRYVQAAFLRAAGTKRGFRSAAFKDT